MDPISESLHSTKPPVWVRSTDKVIAGVCSGIAKQLDLPAWVVRALWIGAIFFAGTGVLLYLAFAIALPKEDDPMHGLRPKVLGVCARIGRRGDMEVGVARLLALLLLFASCGAAILAYVILAFVLPKYPATERRNV